MADLVLAMLNLRILLLASYLVKIMVCSRITMRWIRNPFSCICLAQYESLSSSKIEEHSISAEDEEKSHLCDRSYCEFWLVNITEYLEKWNVDG
jgi:hypothetical protein